MYLMKRTLLLRVNLKILPAVMSFLFITASTPMLSASLMYSRFSTSAIVLGTPRLFAATQARMFVSELLVTATNASYSLIDSSRSMSEFRPSPFTTITFDGNFSERSRHLALFISISLMESSCLLNCLATISPIGLPPRIMRFLTSMLSLPIYLVSISIPSLLEMMNTRSWYLNLVSNFGMMVSSCREMATTLNFWPSCAATALNSAMFIPISSDSSSSLNTAIWSFPRANSRDSVVAVRLSRSAISPAAIFSG